MPGDWAGRSVLVAGAGIAGTACAEALLARGAQVTVVDRAESERTEALVAAGATVVVVVFPLVPVIPSQTGGGAVPASSRCSRQASSGSL